jgi:hypothetical protein
LTPEISPDRQRSAVFVCCLHRQDAGEQGELHPPSIVERDNDARELLAKTA